jgi:hypothetical protein
MLKLLEFSSGAMPNTPRLSESAFPRSVLVLDYTSFQTIPVPVPVSFPTGPPPSAPVRASPFHARIHHLHPLDSDAAAQELRKPLSLLHSLPRDSDGRSLQVT